MVANAALIELDLFINKQVVPFTIVRYVDDILLVMHNTSKLTSSTDFWEWIINRDGGKELLCREKGSILFEPGYLADSRIAFREQQEQVVRHLAAQVWHWSTPSREQDQPAR